MTLLEHGEFLTRHGHETEAGELLAEAREIFEVLEATPWLERVERAAEPAPQPA